MNIFYPSGDTHYCARWLGDKHVIKMPLETAQLLSTAHRLCGGREDVYRVTHRNHPTALWVRERRGNYLWTWQLLNALLHEFKFRRGKEHASGRLLGRLRNIPPEIKPGQFRPPPLVMPERFHVEQPTEGFGAGGGPTQGAYRNYYYHKWREGIVEYQMGRKMPRWLGRRIAQEGRVEYEKSLRMQAGIPEADA